MLPTCAQVWQVPAQPVLQQTPSTQLPLAHWAPAVQAVPFVSFGTHRPAWQ